MIRWLLILAVLASQAVAQTTPVILISIDTWRGDHIGVHPDSKAYTPNIDLVARDGIYYQRAFSTAPWTLPAFGSIYTGLRPYRHGGISRGTAVGWELPRLATYFKAHDYETAAFVNVSFLTSKHGMDRGFEAFAFRRPARAPPFKPKNLKATTADAMDYIAEHRNDNFFLHVHYYDCHAPYPELAEWGNSYYDRTGMWADPDVLDCMIREFCASVGFARAARPPYRPWLDPKPDLGQPIAQYAGAATMVDSHVGLLIAQMRRLGIYRQALVCILSDHGEHMGEHGVCFDHFVPTYSTLHVPLILKFPDNKWAGKVEKDPVSTMDLLPTLLDYFDWPAQVKLDGHSLLGRERTVIAAEHGPSASNCIKTLIDWPWELVYFSPIDDYWLFNLEDDPLELENLTGRERRRLERMADEMWEIFDRDNLIGGPVDEVELSPEEIENLEALGY